MKKKLLLLLIVLFVCSNAKGQNPTYGDEFLKWVKTNAKDYSFRLAKADYKMRLAGIFASHYQKKTNDQNKVSASLDSLRMIVEGQEKNIRELADYNDEIKIALQRSAQAQKMLDELGKVLKQLEEIETSQVRLDSLGNKNNFLFSGLSHVGKENILESIVNLGNSLTNTLVADYTIGVYYSSDQSGATISMNSTSGSGVSASIAGACFLASRILQAAELYPYAFAFAVLGVMVGSDAVVRFNKKIEEQNKIVDQALVLFEKIIPSMEEFYTLYRLEYNKNMDEFKERRFQLDSISSKQSQFWKDLYRYNVYRLESSKLILTEQKIKQLQNSYQNQTSIQKLFNSKLLNELNIDLSKQSDVIDQLERKSISEIDPLKKIIANEEYQDALYEAQAWIEVLKNEVAFIPLFKKIEIKQTEINLRLKLMSENSLFEKSWSDQLPKFLKENKKSNLEILKVDKLIKKIAEEPINSISKLDGSIYGAEMADSQIQQPYISFREGIYNLSYTNDGSFRSKFPAGSDLINLIISGTFDGGNKSDARSASGIDKLNVATNNLNARIGKLESDFNSFSKFKTDWDKASREFNSKLLNTVEKNLAVAQNQFRAFQTDNQHAVERISQNMQTFLTSHINTKSLNRFLDDTKIYSQATRNLPNYHTRVASANILNRSLSSSVFPASNSNQQNEVLREDFKNKVSADQVDSRVLNNFKNGNPDPVFSSMEDYNLIKKVLSTSLSYADYFSDLKNEIVKRLPMSAIKVSNGYLHQAKLLRYYSQGKLSEIEFKDYSIVDSDFLAEEYQKLLVEFNMTCNVGNAGDAQTPCNRFTAMALKSIYNIDDFMNFPSGDNQSVALANQIFEYVSTNDKWHLIGPANNQMSNDKAALYAAEGRPVIAIQPKIPTGHVCIVLPGIPREGTSKPGYGPVTLPYVASWFVNRPQDSFYNKKISYAFSDGEGVVYYYRDVE